MITIENLKDIYEENTPILVSDIEKKFNNYSKETIRKSVSLLAKSGELKRFSKGVYFISKKTIIGDSFLDVNLLIKKKYLGSEDNPFGVYSGLKLLNDLRLTTQVPNVSEIITNNETNAKREVFLDNKKIILRKSKVKITSNNIKIIEFIEALKALPDTIEEDKYRVLSNYIKKYNLTRSKLDNVLIFYPRKVYKKIVESGLINEIAS